MPLIASSVALLASSLSRVYHIMLVQSNLLEIGTSWNLGAVDLERYLHLQP